MEEILSGYSVEQFTKEGYKTLVEANKNANALPGICDWRYYNTFETFTNIINNQSDKIQSLMHSVLRTNSVDGNIRHRSLEEKTELLVEANDIILERVANNIDEMNGIRKTVNEPVIIQTVSATLPINGSWNRINNATFSVSSSVSVEVTKKSSQNAIKLLTAKNIIRPQKLFKDKINNNGTMPWEPRIKEKPNSLKPLAIFLEETENGEEYSHPYEYELDRFTPADEFLKREKLIQIKSTEETPLVEIDNPEQLPLLLEELRGCTEFAVDLEHHSYRSFMGITCLLQISTREKDYIIDTLALRGELHVLNEVFTKPSIVKIFHGAESDIVWLQRDLSLYIVNMFDTHQAAKQLGYSGLSLAYLMQRFCQFIPNKQFQLADWRIRPLPDELKSYAREDTHYLIYIYQMLKNELLKLGNGNNNYLKSVFQRSTELCKKRFFKPVLREDSYLDFYRRCRRLFDNRQLYALKEFYKWRDEISREQDESIGYVLPNHMLLQISETLPREMQGILACCNPIPPLVRSNLLELHKIVLKAREQPLEKAILKEDTRARGVTSKISKVNVDSPLNCPHDLTKSQEFRDDLPTLLKSKNIQKLKLDEKVAVAKDASIYSVFNITDNLDQHQCRKLKTLTFLGPYERYKLVKPFIKAEEERLAAEKEKEENKKNESNGERTDAATAQDTTDTRTVEDRIESIRQHFLTLTQNSKPKKNESELDLTLPLNKSLVNMGGTKKRKRESSEDQDSEADTSSEQALHTPVPNLQNRKRKSNEAFETSQGKVGKINTNSSSQQNITKKKNKRWLKRPNQSHEGRPEVPRKQNKRQGRQKQQHKSNLQKEHNSGQNRQQALENIVGGDGAQTKQQTGRNQKRNKNNFTAFDYSSVDFRQFQGGAAGAQKPKQFKSNYKGKAKNKLGNKGQNKTFTYGKGKH